MKIVTESAAQQDLGSLVEQVWENHVPVVIQRENGHSAVVISLEEYQEID
jgi:prevent-host-death family protein